MGIFDAKPLKVRANNLLELARRERENGRIAFAEQLTAQAHKYFKELAATTDRTGDDRNDR